MCVHRKQAGGLKPLQPARFDRGRCQPPSHDQPAHCNTLRHHSDISACCSGHRGSLRSNWLASLQRMFSAEDLRYCLQRALNVQVLCRGSRMFQCEQCSWACVPVVLMQSPLRISSAAGSAMLQSGAHGGFFYDSDCCLLHVIIIYTHPLAPLAIGGE